MFRSRWLGNLLSLVPSRKDRRRWAVAQRRRIRPMLETLEDRLTPSSVMENAADAATLQTDLSNATAAHTQYLINLTGDSSAYHLAAGQQLTVSAAGLGSSVTIAGTGQSITGNGNRVVFVHGGANVTLENLTITGGSTVASGGGIFNSGGNITLNNVTVQGNTAAGSNAEGGGIFVSEGGSLTIEGGSVIASNKAISQSISLDNYAYGGGVYASGASTIAIFDSALSNNSARGSAGLDGTAVGADGTLGGSASGGGLYVGGSGWTVTLIGDTFSGNAAIGGNGGNAAAGTANNVRDGNGGYGGDGGGASGGAAVFTDNGRANTRLTILDDPAAPTSHPSLFLDNSVQSGSGGNGGAGDTSTGTANNSFGGGGGAGGDASGGAVVVHGALFPPPATAPMDGSGDGLSFTVNIGNTTFYGNKVSTGNGGAGGAAGSGGAGKPGGAGQNLWGGDASGGGLSLSGGNITLVNCTVANNTITPGLGYGGARNGEALGGGIDVGSGVTLDNNTITQNSLNGTANYGSALWIEGNPTLVNNLIQGNQSIGSSANDLDVQATRTLSNASNNFITSISPNAVSTTTNIIGNSQPQLGGVVGVTADGQPSGGPIYYPLLSNTVSIGAGTTSVLNTIANVEGTTPDNATGEIGNLRSSNGSIDLGAVQFQNPNSSSAPIITSNPSSQSVKEGTNASFTASAIGTPVPTAQWQVSSDGGKTFTNISGATATLMLNNVTTAMSGYEYRAVFSNSAGNVTTSAATLTVNAAVTAAPYIVSNPVSQTVTAGTTVTFTASAGGTPTPTVQWQYSFGGPFGFENIPGATSPTLTLNNVTVVTRSGAYQAVFTNSDGSITSRAARLIVNAALSPLPPPPPPPPQSPALHVPPLLSFFDALLRGTETVNANGTETITDRFFGITLFVSTFDSSGHLMSVDLFGFNITFLFVFV